MDLLQNNFPSLTAYQVAMSIVILGKKNAQNNSLTFETAHATEKMLVACGVASEESLRLARSLWSNSICEIFDRIMPGQLESFVHRKVFCEKQVREGIDACAKQVLVLGAGYDTLGWRLSDEFPHVHFFEIDHPATARLKANGIATMGRRENLHLLAEDLGKRKLEDTLSANAAWLSSVQTVIIAEGLLMYLCAKTVCDLLYQCADITGPGSRFVFSYIPSDANGDPDVGQWKQWILWIQSISGEPWSWSIRTEKLGPFLEATGWNLMLDKEETLHKHGVERLAVATRS